MAKKGYTPEQIINKLREAEILLSQGDLPPENESSFMLDWELIMAPVFG